MHGDYDIDYTKAAAAERSWAVVPRIMTSDLLAFSCMPFRRNQSGSQSRPRFGLGGLMILERQGELERFRCVAITLAEIYENNYPTQ